MYIVNTINAFKVKTICFFSLSEIIMLLDTFAFTCLHAIPAKYYQVNKQECLSACATMWPTSKEIVNDSST